MSKLITICAVVLLIVFGSANITLASNTVADSQDLNTSWLDGEQTYSWTHTWAFIPPVDTVDAATLDILAYDVSSNQGDIIPVTLDGISLGNLSPTGTSLSGTTSFTLDAAALAQLKDGSATISLNIPNQKSIKIRVSTITIEYSPPRAFADYGSGTTIEISVGKGIWQLNFGQGPWTWSDDTSEPLLDSNVSGILDLHATAPADVSADLLATLPIAGKLTLTAHDTDYMQACFPG